MCGTTMEVLMTICTLVCKSVVIEPFTRLTLRSKNVTLFRWLVCKLKVREKIVQFLHKLFQFCFSMRPNKKDIVNISQPSKWLKLLRFRKISEICCLISLINSKKLFLRTNSANLTRSLVGIFEEVGSSNLLFNAKIPSLCGMLRYRTTTSAVTRK